MILLVLLLSSTFTSGKVYERCELARELKFVHQAPPDQLATWVCIAEHESLYNTSVVGHLCGDSGDHGLFQISDKYWCSSPNKGKACEITCEELEDDNISDDFACANRIFSEHKRLSGDGFNAWAVYKPYCKGSKSDGYIKDCFNDDVGVDVAQTPPTPSVFAHGFFGTLQARLTQPTQTTFDAFFTSKTTQTTTYSPPVKTNQAYYNSYSSITTTTRPNYPTTRTTVHSNPTTSRLYTTTSRPFTTTTTGRRVFPNLGSSRFSSPFSSRSSFSNPTPSRSSFPNPTPTRSTFSNPTSTRSSFSNPIPTRSSFANPTYTRSSFSNPKSSFSSFTSSSSSFSNPTQTRTIYTNPTPNRSVFGDPKLSRSIFSNPKTTDRTIFNPVPARSGIYNSGTSLIQTSKVSTTKCGSTFFVPPTGTTIDKSNARNSLSNEPVFIFNGVKWYK